MTDNSDILNKAWTDDAFMHRLESDPRAALTETGHEVPEDVEVRLVRDSDNVRYLHVPTAPYEDDLSDADLMVANGGIYIWGPHTLPPTVTVSFVPPDE